MFMLGIPIVGSLGAWLTDGHDLEGWENPAESWAIIVLAVLFGLLAVSFALKAYLERRAVRGGKPCAVYRGPSRMRRSLVIALVAFLVFIPLIYVFAGADMQEVVRFSGMLKTTILGCLTLFVLHTLFCLAFPRCRAHGFWKRTQDPAR